MANGLETVTAEKNKILQSERESKNIQGLRILGLNKTFLLQQKCCGKPKLLEALKEVNKSKK